MLKPIFVLLFALILLSCTPIEKPKSKVITAVREEAGSISVVFCPRQDCEAELAKFISSENNYVYCAFFDLDLEQVITALKKKSKTTDVRVVVDKDNYLIVKNMSFIKPDTRSAFMHNKFCVKDNKWLSTGSFNPTDRDAHYNNNNLIFVESRYLAENYKDEFNELWKGDFGKGSNVKYPVVYLGGTRIENRFCPEDDCGEKIKNTLKKAASSIYFMTFSFTHNRIANELVLKHIDGINVKGIFEKRGTGTNYSKFSLLDYQGIDVRKDTNSYVLHHKVFIVDNTTVITGSFNPSTNADKKNDENILIISNAALASKYLNEFDYLWMNFSS